MIERGRYCNGLFIHYKTKDKVLHGEFKQTYGTTIEVVLNMIKELASLMDQIPAAKVVPTFEESKMYPAGYPKELPKLKEPGRSSFSLLIVAVRDVLLEHCACVI